MEAVVHQPFGDVGLIDPARLLEAAADRRSSRAPRAPVSRVYSTGIVPLQPGLDVVRVQDRVAAWPRVMPVAAEHADVAVRDQQNARAADQGAAATAGIALRAAGPASSRMARQVRRQMRARRQSAPCPVRRRHAGCRTSCADSGGTHPRRSPPGWSARPARSYSRRPCTPGRRARGRSRRCPGSLSSNTPCVDGYVTISAASRRDAARPSPRGRRRRCCLRGRTPTTTTRMPGHHGARRIGAVRRGRDQQTSRCVSPRSSMIRADHQQPGEFALRAGVRLQRHRGKAGDLAQAPAPAPEDLLIALRPARPARTDGAARIRPGDRQHLRRGVQLHRAGAERDHRRVEPDVLRARGCGCSASSRVSE